MDSHSLHEEIRVTTKTQPKIETGTNKIEKGLKKKHQSKETYMKLLYMRGRQKNRAQEKLGFRDN